MLFRTGIVHAELQDVPLITGLAVMDLQLVNVQRLPFLRAERRRQYAVGHKRFPRLQLLAL